MMGILFIVMAVSLAAATFIENDFGQAAARAAVYNTLWFELLFLLLAINLTGQIFIFKLWRREKLTVFRIGIMQIERPGCGKTGIWIFDLILNIVLI